MLSLLKHLATNAAAAPWLRDFVNPDFTTRSHRAMCRCQRRLIQHDLRHAISRNRLSLVYQPQVRGPLPQLEEALDLPLRLVG